MEYFLKLKELNKKSQQKIKVNKKTFIIQNIEYQLFTYSLNLPKNKFEDDIYASDKDLLTFLPRACSILVRNNIIISSLEGPQKFSGKTNIDEDPDDGQDEISQTNSIYDHNKILSWASSNTLEIIETEKANGKFAIFKLIFDNGTPILLVGSKNNHFALSFDQIDSLKSSNDIISSILLDIKNNWDKLNSHDILSLFNDGYSLAGELCDGQHFTPGDNTISWFGFFKSGQVYDTIKSLDLLNSIGLKTVPYFKVYDSSSNISIDSIFLSSRCKNNEGSVLRCVNIDTNETILVKTKSVSYIVKRFMRQIILRGYKDIERIKYRFIDAQKYHGLGTDASIRITKQLLNFAFWMMNKKYPCSVLGVTSVTSVKGQLPNGFNTYWTEWMNTTYNQDIIINLDDFGDFSSDRYLKETELYSPRSYFNPAIVIFFQGLQGSGKSTVGSDVCLKLSNLGINSTYIEQDDYWGDTLACQGALYHSIASESGPNVILVTRCNVNKNQYKRYLDIAHKLPSIVSFVSPNNFNSLYFMISLAGIINRSTFGDKLMVGRFEYPLSDVINFTLKNYNDFEIVTNSLKLDFYHTNTDLENKTNNIMNSNIAIEDFIKTNYEILNNLRYPIDEISQNIVNHITHLLNGHIKNIELQLNPIYIGFAVSPIDKIELNNFVDHHINLSNFINYNHHCTYEFYGSKSNVTINKNILPGQIISAYIDSLIIRKLDKACAFKISKLINNDTKKEITLKHQAHITAKIPNHLKPNCSNSFVGLSDNSVDIINFNKELKLICFWC